MQQAVEYLHDFLWGPALLAALLILGLYFGHKTHWFQLHLLQILKQALLSGRQSARGKQGISPLRAASTALAGTVGTGNIVGVSAALLVGGAGSVFWMWVSALIGMGIKYAEVLLAVAYREGKSIARGGPMYYMEHGLKRKSLAVFFSAAAIASALTGGSFTQTNAVCAALGQEQTGAALGVGAVLALLVGVCIFGGLKRISRVTAVLVPVFSVLFLGGGLVVIASEWRGIPAALALIFQEAFSLKSVSGGLFGSGLALALRMGVARGIFSNEAGVGSSPMVYAASEDADAVRQGFWGVLEVFADTIVICTVTALAVLLQVGVDASKTPMQLVRSAFSSALGEWAEPILCASVVLFAFAALLSWCFYGEQGVVYLTKRKRAVAVYRCFFAAACWLGAAFPSESVWLLGDCCNAFMLLPNLAALILLRGEVLKISFSSPTFRALHPWFRPDKTLCETNKNRKNN